MSTHVYFWYLAVIFLTSFPTLQQNRTRTLSTEILITLTTTASTTTTTFSTLHDAPFARWTLCCIYRPPSTLATKSLRSPFISLTAAHQFVHTLCVRAQYLLEAATTKLKWPWNGGDGVDGAKPCVPEFAFKFTHFYTSRARVQISPVPPLCSAQGHSNVRVDNAMVRVNWLSRIQPWPSFHRTASDGVLRFEFRCSRELTEVAISVRFVLGVFTATFCLKKTVLKRSAHVGDVRKNTSFLRR